MSNWNVIVTFVSLFYTFWHLLYVVHIQSWKLYQLNVNVAHTQCCTIAHLILWQTIETHRAFENSRVAAMIAHLNRKKHKRNKWKTISFCCCQLKSCFPFPSERDKAQRMIERVREEGERLGVWECERGITNVKCDAWQLANWWVTIYSDTFAQQVAQVAKFN